MQEIQGVVDDVKERISEYEEIKSSFADPEVNIPYSIQNMSGKSPHERRGSSSEHSTPKSFNPHPAREAQAPPSRLYFTKGPSSTKQRRGFGSGDNILK